MAITTDKYRHKIKIMYEQDGTLKEFGKESITNLIVNYDYDKYNMPLMFLKISLEKTLIDDMIKNKSKKFITLYIDKFVYGQSIQIYSSYVKDQFIYFMDENLNDNNSLDYNSANSDSTNQRLITIGLMKLANINDNKCTISGIYNNVGLLELLLSNLTHMKLLMEPLPKNQEVTNFSIPILNSVIKFIDYVSNQYSVYNTNYRFFIDFDKTYLLSSVGKSVPSSDEKYNKVIFQVADIASTNSRIEGMTIDDNAQCYIIHLTNTDLNMFQNKAVTMNNNTLVGVDSQGNTTTVALNNDSTIDTKSKVEVIKTTNLDNISNIKNSIDTNNTIINIIKSEIDSTILTINKEYIIQGHSDTRINGNYLLASKKEIYTRKDDDFSINCIFTLRKIS